MLDDLIPLLLQHRQVKQPMTVVLTMNALAAFGKAGLSYRLHVVRCTSSGWPPACVARVRDYTVQTVVEAMISLRGTCALACRVTLSVY